MLIEIWVTNPRRTDLPPLTLPLRDPDRFPIVFIDGLGPVSAELSSTPYANYAGEYLQSSRIGVRNIVMTLDLEPSYSDGEDVESLRDVLYDYFQNGGTVDLEFITDKHTRYISGVVEDVNPPMFVDKPQIQISIVCHDPYFTDGEEREVVGVTESGALNIHNYGKVSEGFRLNVIFGSSGESLVVSTNDDTSRPLQIHHTFSEGVEIFVDTRDLNKNAMLADSSLIPSITHGSGWPRLRPGSNELTVDLEGSDGEHEVTLRFRERFTGL